MIFEAGDETREKILALNKSEERSEKSDFGAEQK